MYLKSKDKTINEFFFFASADCLISTHFPFEKAWQLLSEPVSRKNFEKFLYIRERFYDLGLKIKEESQYHRDCQIESVNGKIDIKIGLPNTISTHIYLSCKLFNVNSPESSKCVLSIVKVSLFYLFFFHFKFLNNIYSNHKVKKKAVLLSKYLYHSLRNRTVLIV